MSTPVLSRTIIVDTREQLPWKLVGYETVRQKLEEGDYSLLGLEGVVSIERKTLCDFVSSISKGRARFMREMERLRDSVRYPFLFIEASREEVALHMYRSLMHPTAVAGTCLSLMVEFGVPVWWAGSRRQAELDAVRLFQDVERRVNRGSQPGDELEEQTQHRRTAGGEG